MRGPFPLAPHMINCRVPSQARGIYCLGKTPGQVAVVGRADHDLGGEIRRHSHGYLYFWFEPSLTPRETYNAQCRFYHRYIETGSLEDKSHPPVPPDLDAKCPVCGR